MYTFSTDPIPILPPPHISLLAALEPFIRPLFVSRHDSTLISRVRDRTDITRTDERMMEELFSLSISPHLFSVTGSCFPHSNARHEARIFCCKKPETECIVKGKGREEPSPSGCERGWRRAAREPGQGRRTVDSSHSVSKIGSVLIEED